MLKEYNEIKDEIQNPKISVEYAINMVDTYEINGVETIVCSDEILRFK